MPQVPKLLQPRQAPRLSGLFDDDVVDFDPFDYSVPDLPIVDPGTYVYTFDDTGVSDLIYDAYETIFVDDNGNTVDADGNVLISADEVAQIAAENPGNEAAAVARVVQQKSPDWASQFRSTDELIRAAASLLTTVKAVASGKPVPQNPTYPPGTHPGGGSGGGSGSRPVQKPGGGFSVGSLVPGNIPPVLLIGGAAAAFFLLRRK